MKRRVPLLLVVSTICLPGGCSQRLPESFLMELAHKQQQEHTAIGGVYDRELNLIVLHPGPGLQTFHLPEPGFYEVAVAPSGHFFGVSRKNENIFVAARADGSVIWSREGLFAEDIPEISPGEDWLVFKGRDATSGKAGLLLVGDQGHSITVVSRGATNPSWSSDGSQIVYEEANFVYVYSRLIGTSKQIVRGTKPRWSPDGAAVSVLLEGGQLAMLDPQGNAKKQFFVGTEVKTPFYWAPDSEYMMYFKKGGFFEGIGCFDESEDLMILRARDGAIARLMEFCRSYPYNSLRWFRIPSDVTLNGSNPTDIEPSKEPQAD